MDGFSGLTAGSGAQITPGSGPMVDGIDAVHSIIHGTGCLAMAGTEHTKRPPPRAFLGLHSGEQTVEMRSFADASVDARHFFLDVRGSKANHHVSGATMGRQSKRLPVNTWKPKGLMLMMMSIQHRASPT